MLFPGRLGADLGFAPQRRLRSLQQVYWFWGEQYSVFPLYLGLVPSGCISSKLCNMSIWHRSVCLSRARATLWDGQQGWAEAGLASEPDPLLWGEGVDGGCWHCRCLLLWEPEPGSGMTCLAVRHMQGPSLLPVHPVSSLGTCTMCLTGLACFKLLIQSGREGCAPWITRLLNFDVLVSNLSKQLILFPGDCVNKQGAMGISPKLVGQEAFLMPSLKYTCACFSQRKMWCSEHVSPKQMKRRMQAMLFRSLI